MTPLAVIDQICPDTLQGWRDGWQDGGVEAWQLEMCSREVDLGLVRVCPGALWLSQWPAQENSHDGARTPLLILVLLLQNPPTVHPVARATD